MDAQLSRRQLAFLSQSRLFRFIESTTPTNLTKVRTLTLLLTDIDLSKLNAKDTPKSDLWSLYQRELERLDHALTLLPNLSELTITPPRSTQSQLPQTLYCSFLALVVKRLPKLRKLTVDDGVAVLEKVPSLRKLQEVEFSVDGVMEKFASSRTAGNGQVLGEIDVNGGARRRSCAPVDVKRGGYDMVVKAGVVRA